MTLRVKAQIHNNKHQTTFEEVKTRDIGFESTDLVGVRLELFSVDFEKQVYQRVCQIGKLFGKL